MKKNLLSLFVIGCAMFVSAQTTRTMPALEDWKKEFSKCGTMENLERLKKQHPEIEQQMKAYEAKIQEFIAQFPEGKTSNQQVFSSCVYRFAQ